MFFFLVKNYKLNFFSVFINKISKSNKKEGEKIEFNYNFKIKIKKKNNCFYYFTFRKMLNF